MMTTIKNFDSDFSITDESLGQVQRTDCKLLLEIDAGEISYALLSSKNNRFLVFKSYEYDSTENLNELINIDEFLNCKEYEQVVFSIVNAKSTLVPNAFYDDEKKADLLLFNHPIEADESIAKDDFRFFDAKNIFAVKDDLIHFIEKNFNNPSLHHCSTSLIESLLLRNKNRKQPIVNANMHQHQFELTVIENNQLLFYNALPCPTAEDFIYYLLFMFEQLELNPESVALELSGKIQNNSAFHTIAKKYIRNVNFASRTINHEFSYGFENLPPHHHLSLFDLSLCV
ncbi:MAG: DUF3822 family protein [Bacteroidia bacterium]